MKAADLIKVWGAPDNSRLTAKQSSFRLPVHVAAKLAALADIYPNKTKTEIVGDLLSSAIAEIEKALPSYPGQYVMDHPETGERVYEEEGPKARFRVLVNKYYAELERELGNESPELPYSSDSYLISEEKD